MINKRRQLGRKAISAAVLALAAAPVAACADAHADDAGYQGVVEVEEQVLGFELGGRLDAVPVERGDTVEPAAIVASLDDTLAKLERDAKAAEVRAGEAQLELLREGPRDEEIRATRAELGAAAATLASAESALARQRTLVARGASASAATDELEARVAQARAHRDATSQTLRALRDGARAQDVTAAEARLDAARTGLDAVDERIARHELRATIAAVVLDVHAEPGEVVAPGAPVVTVGDVARPYVDVFVPQDELARIELGAAAHVRVDAHSRTFAGRVEHIGRRTEFTPRYLFSDRERPNLVVRVRIRIDDPDADLPAGVPAFVSIGSPSRGAR